MKLLLFVVSAAVATFAQGQLSLAPPGAGACLETQTPVTLQATYDRGACFLQVGLWAEAAQQFRAYTQVAPDDFRGWLMRSRAELHGKSFKEAQEHANKAVALSPKSVEAYRSLGEADLELHDNEGAYQAWLKGHELDPKDARIDYYLGRLFFEAEFWNEAAAWLKKTLELQPHDFAAMTYLGMAADRLNFPDTAMQLFRAAVEESKQQGKPYSWAYLAEAKHLHEQGKDQQALALLEEAERLCPEPHALAEEGQLLATTAPERAENLLRRALSMDNAIPEAHYRLALLLRSKGNSKEADEQFQEFRSTRDAEQASKHSVQAIRRN